MPHRQQASFDFADAVVTDYQRLIEATGVPSAGEMALMVVIIIYFSIETCLLPN